jgi:hypothetical protein
MAGVVVGSDGVRGAHSGVNVNQRQLQRQLQLHSLRGHRRHGVLVVVTAAAAAVTVAGQVNLRAVCRMS